MNWVRTGSPFDVLLVSATHARCTRVDDDNLQATPKIRGRLKVSSTDCVGWNYRNANANLLAGSF